MLLPRLSWQPTPTGWSATDMALSGHSPPGAVDRLNTQASRDDAEHRHRARVAAGLHGEASSSAVVAAGAADVAPVAALTALAPTQLLPGRAIVAGTRKQVAHAAAHRVMGDQTCRAAARDEVEERCPGRPPAQRSGLVADRVPPPRQCRTAEVHGNG